MAEEGAPKPKPQISQEEIAAGLSSIQKTAGKYPLYNH